MGEQLVLVIDLTSYRGMTGSMDTAQAPDTQLYAHTERAEEGPYEVEVAVTGKPHAVKVLVTGTC